MPNIATTQRLRREAEKALRECIGSFRSSDWMTSDQTLKGLRALGQGAGNTPSIARAAEEMIMDLAMTAQRQQPPTLTPAQIERRRAILTEMSAVSMKIGNFKYESEREARRARQRELHQMLDSDPSDDEATAQRLKLEAEAAQRRQRQRTVPPSAELEHRERNAHRVLALQELADKLAGAAMDAIEQERGIVRAQIAERLHAVLLSSGAWRQYPPERVPPMRRTLRMD